MISKAMRHVPIIVALLFLAGCSTMQTSSSVPSDTAGGKKGCACCSKMHSETPGEHKGCSCCGGMHGDKGMMCEPKDKAGDTGHAH